MDIRKLNNDDVEDLYAITNNINIMKWVGNGKVWSLQRVKSFIEWNMAHPEDDFYAITENNKVIGIVGTKEYTFHKNIMFGKLAVTIFLSVHRKGYATRAIQYLQDHHPEDELYASIDADNEPSFNLFKKCGFDIVERYDFPGHGIVYIMKWHK